MLVISGDDGDVMILPGAPCPCGTTQPWSQCCARVHADIAAAHTAEQLMRARYSAHVVGNKAFLAASWSPQTRPTGPLTSGDVTWSGLEILATSNGGPDDQIGEVEFRASFVRGGEPHTLHERSRFERRAGRWVYVDGDALG